MKHAYVQKKKGIISRLLYVSGFILLLFCILLSFSLILHKQLTILIHPFVLAPKPASPSPSYLVDNAASLAAFNYPAPELSGATGWINSAPIEHISTLHGKVVLIHFWKRYCTYCSYWYPEINRLYTTYKNRGFTVIGVSSPQYPDEKTTAVIAQITKHYQIDYPVAVDDNLVIFNSYNIQYWPAYFLLDTAGHVRFFTYGAQKGNTIEQTIQMLLAQSHL